MRSAVLGRDRHIGAVARGPQRDRQPDAARPRRRMNSVCSALWERALFPDLQLRKNAPPSNRVRRSTLFISGGSRGIGLAIALRAGARRRQ